MKSFAAHIIYRIICSKMKTEQYEEQWRILYATDERAALEEARKLGKNEECTFTDRYGRTVTWEMIAVKELNEVIMQHGALLFSTVKEVEPIADPVWTNHSQQPH